jgi:PIN domain nuclease of toxin-antitoxin system
MSKFVLDASAILAAANNEPGADFVVAHSSEAIVSTVNLAEAHSKLILLGLPESDAWEIALSFCSEVISFDAAQSRIAGALISSTRSLGLSLGDRACLALGMLLRAPVYTTDRSWKKLNLQVEIRLLR